MCVCVVIALKAVDFMLSFSLKFLMRVHTRDSYNSTNGP